MKTIKTVAYVLAMLMILAASFILPFKYNITDFWEQTFIVSYMIIYGALISLGSIKGVKSE